MTDADHDRQPVADSVVDGDTVQPGAHPADLDLAPWQRDDIRTVAESGVFDVEWYELQRGRSFPTGHDAVRDFVLEGGELGLGPHPLYSHAWVTRNDAAPVDPVRVFVRYLTDAPFARAISTHPFFDPRALPPATANASCPLSAFLRTAMGGTPLPYLAEEIGAAPGIELDDVVRAGRDAVDAWQTEHSNAPGEDPAGTLPTLAAETLDAGARGKLTFLLVITAEADEFRSVHENLAGPRSVQRHGDWELLVVDPFHVEDAALAVATVAARDPRVRLVPPGDGGLPGAVQAAVEAATGSAVVFCDPRLTWAPRFAPTAVAALSRAPAIRTGDAAGRPLLPADAGLPGLVVATDVLHRIVPLDPELGEAYEVHVLRQVRDMTGPVPVLTGDDVAGTWTAPVPRPDVPVSARAAAVVDTDEWRRAAPAAPSDGLTTLVLHGVRTRSIGDALREAERFTDQTSAEVVITWADETWQSRLLLAVLSLVPSAPAAVTGPANAGLLLNRALRRASGARTVVLGPGQTLTGAPEDWRALLDDVEASGIVAHPLVLDGHDVIVDAGSYYPGESAEPAVLLRGVPRPAVPLVRRTTVPGAELPLVLRTADARAVGGFDPVLDDVWLGNDLVRRLDLAFDAETVLVDDVGARAGDSAGTWEPRDRRTAVTQFRTRWPTAPKTPAPLPEWHVTALDHGTAAWSDPAHPDAWGHGTWLVGGRLEVNESPGSSRWLLLPRRGADRETPVSGQSFASSLARALRRQGQHVVVDEPRAHGSVYRPDVVLDLDGSDRTVVPAGPRTVLWATDDVDTIDTARLRGYDLAFAAAPIWARDVAEREGIRVRHLLNCTDPEAFSYDALTPFQQRPETVTVGDCTPWRLDGVRTSVREAWRLGNHFRVHGRGWSDHLPPHFRGRPVESAEELRDLYRQAFYVTVHHRPELRELGLVSSQVFDVLACGGHLLTDDVAGLDDLFGGHVGVYRSRLELAWSYSLEWVCYYPTPEGQQRLAAEIARKHSFDARAATLIDAVRHDRAAP